MANPNQNNMDALTFNTIGVRPVECSFNIDPDTFRGKLKEIIGSIISDLQDVTYIPDKESGFVSWFAWFPSNCDHFVDHQTDNTMVSRSIKRYSEQFKDFAKKYGWAPFDNDPIHGDTKVDMNKIVGNNDNRERGKYTYIQLSTFPLIGIMFDGQGTEFKKQSGKDSPKVVLQREYIWSTNKEGRRTSFNGIRITKGVNGQLRFNRNDLIPEKAKKF